VISLFLTFYKGPEYTISQAIMHWCQKERKHNISLQAHLPPRSTVALTAAHLNFMDNYLLPSVSVCSRESLKIDIQHRLVGTDNQSVQLGSTRMFNCCYCCYSFRGITRIATPTDRIDYPDKKVSCL